MRNRKAVWALVRGAPRARGARRRRRTLARHYDEVRVLRRGHRRADRARALARRPCSSAGGRGLSTSGRWGEAAAAVSSPVTRLLGTFAFLVALTAALALAVFAVLVLVVE